MRLILAAALLALTSCAPTLLVPASGAEIPYESCGAVPSGIVVRRYATDCPDLSRINRIAGDVRADHRACSFEGVRVDVVGGYLLGPREEPVYAVTRGDRITVSDGRGFYGTVRHELHHHCGCDFADPLR